MSVVSTYRGIVSDIAEVLVGDGPGSFRIERDEYHAPDLIYTLKSPRTWNAQAKYIPIADKPVEITYSLPNLYETFETVGADDEVEDFLTYYQIVELEEITHCMGEVDVDDDHSQKWMNFLADSVISHTSDADYVEIRFCEK